MSYTIIDKDISGAKQFDSGEKSITMFRVCQRGQFTKLGAKEDFFSEKQCLANKTCSGQGLS